jgi:hypothetical protein
MNLSNRKPLYLALALTLAAPLAFAQSTTPTTATQDATNAATSATQDATNAATQAATQEATTSATQDATAQTQSAMPKSGEPEKKNWSDLDVDKNGTLSATEAASVQNLSSVFAKADANADGELTQDEYKAYLAANGKGEAKSDSGG